MRKLTIYHQHFSFLVITSIVDYKNLEHSTIALFSFSIIIMTFSKYL